MIHSKFHDEVRRGDTRKAAFRLNPDSLCIQLKASMLFIVFVTLVFATDTGISLSTT
jgi:hypothetical protein